MDDDRFPYHRPVRAARERFGPGDPRRRRYPGKCTESARGRR